MRFSGGGSDSFRHLFSRKSRAAFVLAHLTLVNPGQFSEFAYIEIIEEIEEGGDIEPISHLEGARDLDSLFSRFFNHFPDTLQEVFLGDFPNVSASARILNMRVIFRRISFGSDVRRCSVHGYCLPRLIICTLLRPDPPSPLFQRGACRKYFSWIVFPVH